MPSHITKKEWWKEAVIYQIYPASFKDTNGDGLGDIPGIISKVPYIQSLGADAIWLSPIYRSPQKDMGYDVSDYRAIHQPYGTLEDVQTLIDELHARGMRLLMDLVVNHTSDQHAWFLESRESRDSAKRDWYFWRDPKYDDQGRRKEPNNWRSIFGGSAWHYDELTGQYYLALFLPSQPDLNWTNADMREATHDDMRFWLDRGVDGFRIDSMNLMSKHSGLPNGEVITDEPYQDGSEFFASGPKMHEYIQNMRREVFDDYDVMTVGELAGTKTEDSVRPYVAADRKELNMVFTGDIVDMDFGPDHKYTRDDFHPRKIREITDLWQTAMPKFDGWNSVYLDNHDSGRSLSRWASDAPEHRSAAAKMLSMYMMTLAGTPYLLAGQEIGMANLSSDYGAEAYIDVEAKRYYDAVLERRGGHESQMGDVLREMQKKARDHGRLPMQWSSEPNAAFTNERATPWMTINKDYIDWNVTSQLGDSQSILSFWKHMISLRKELTDLLVYGSYGSIPEQETGECVLGWRRECHETGQIAVTLLNFSESVQHVPMNDCRSMTIVAENGRVSVSDGGIKLGPYGGVVLLGSI